MSDLSQDEIDALIGGALTEDEQEPAPEKSDDSPGGAAATASSPPKKRDVDAYDFKQPNPIPEATKKTLNLLHEKYAHKLKVNVSAFLRTEVEIKIQNVEQQNYSQYTDTLNTPTYMATFDMPPLSGYGIMEVNAAIAYAIIDKMLGGDGSVPAQVRPFTDVELAIIKRFTDILMLELGDAWKPILNISFTPQEVQTNPAMVRIIPQKEICLIVTLNIKISDTTGLVTICIPYSNFEPIAFKLGDQQWTKYISKQSEDILSAHRRNFLEIKLDVTAILGRMELSMEELLALQKGDILDLGCKTQEPINLQIAEEDKFKVKPGLLGKNKAVAIHSEI